MNLACDLKCVCGHKEADHASTSPRWCLVKGGCDCAEFESRGAAPTTPAVVLDPFGGTGTTALVAKALGRHGITVDMSADYCRLAEWRTNDRDSLAKVLGVARIGPADDAQLDLFGEATA